LKLLIVGEHPTLNEAGAPFSNGLWRYMRMQLKRLGFDFGEVDWAYTINSPGASMFAYLGPKNLASKYAMPIGKGSYIRNQFDQSLLDLATLIERTKPNLVLCCGDLPLNVLTGLNKIDFARGRVTSALPMFHGVKVLPTYAPRAVLSDLSFEPIFMMDLQKAKRQMEFPEIRRPQRFIHVRPSIEDMEDFWQKYIVPNEYLSCDIETKGTMITCFGVAPAEDRVLVVPFFDEEKKSGNYWETKREELIAWRFVKRCLSEMTKRTVGQNFSYDATSLLRNMGIPSSNWTDDTMLLHHALQPEMKKGLGFQASIYTDEPAWKQMVKRRADDKTGKKEDQ
jgi:hypothetical protein